MKETETVYLTENILALAVKTIHTINQEKEIPMLRSLPLTDLPQQKMKDSRKIHT